MIFLIPFLTRAVVISSGIVVAKSVYDQTKIEQERLEWEKEKVRAASIPPPIQPNKSEEK